MKANKVTPVFTILMFSLALGNLFFFGQAKETRLSLRDLELPYNPECVTQNRLRAVGLLLADDRWVPDGTVVNAH